MGVVNVTPDSFSDGGEALAPRNALCLAKSLTEQGADVIDLGAQSTRPGAIEIDSTEELSRLIPALNLIRSRYLDKIISIDTFYSNVAYKALEGGANWINDTSGGDRDPDIMKVVADAGCPYVIMHNRGNSRTMDKNTQYDNLYLEVRNNLLKKTDRALSLGIKDKQLIWDPGIGFAKTTEQNLSLLRDIEKLKIEGFPLLVGPSRKRFIGDVLNVSSPKSRVWGTAAVVSRCTQAKVEMVRVHDVGPMVQIINMSKVLW